MIFIISCLLGDVDVRITQVIVDFVKSASWIEPNAFEILFVAFFNDIVQSVKRTVAIHHRWRTVQRRNSRFSQHFVRQRMTQL